METKRRDDRTVRYRLYYLLPEVKELEHRRLLSEIRMTEMPVLPFPDPKDTEAFVVLFSGTEADRIQWETYLRKLMDACNIRCGVSCWDNDPLNLSYHIKYARCAALYGVDSHSQIGQYETAFLPLLRELARQEVIFDELPILQYLKAWDVANNSHHYRILKEALINHMNLSETARKTCLSRSTIQRHINQCERILHVDLNDPEIRLILTLSIFLTKA